MEKKYQSYMLEQLEKLLSLKSPSGYTREVQAYLCEEIERIGFQPEELLKGGVRANLGGQGDGVLLFAHVDTLGAVVRYVKSNGRLALSNVGGLDPNNSEAENVTVVTRFDGEYEGTIQVPNASKHVNKDLNKPRSFDDNLEVVLDEDVKSAEDVAKLGICAGDFICLDPRFRVTKQGYVKSRFLDDKASAAVLLAYAKYLKDEGLTPKRNVWISFTVYEEVGHGASSGVPEGIVEGISVDMGCVGDHVTCTERQVSICAKDSGGPYNYDVTNALIETAKKTGVDYAVDVYNYYGSDVEATLKGGYDLRHGLIGPGVYASHGYERTHIDGLVNTFELLKNYLA